MYSLLQRSCHPHKVIEDKLKIDSLTVLWTMMEVDIADVSRHCLYIPKSRQQHYQELWPGLWQPLQKMLNNKTKCSFLGLTYNSLSEISFLNFISSINTKGFNEVKYSTHLDIYITCANLIWYTIYSDNIVTGIRDLLVALEKVQKTCQNKSKG